MEPVEEQPARVDPQITEMIKVLQEEKAKQSMGIDLVPIGNVELTEQNSRLTLRIDAYWEDFHDDPVGRHVVVSQQLQTAQIAPFIRKFKATETPKELSLGDIDREDVGYVLLINLEGTRLFQNPTDEEKQDILKRVVIFNGFEIHPYGLPFLGKVKLDQPLTTHCEHGQAMLQVCIFPR